jgi:hypothetical protein
MDLETLGLLGVFLAGAIPWFEAIAVVPAGILFGLNPLLTVIAGVTGNAVTIFIFAYGGHAIRSRLLARRVAKGLEGESPRFLKAQASFDRWGIYGLAILGPIIIGTQFVALIAVAAGLKPLKVSLIVTIGTTAWAGLIAILMVVFGFDQVGQAFA